MTPERWSQLQPFIDAALDLGPGQRPEYIERVTADDATLRADLESFINRLDRDDPADNADSLLAAAVVARSRLVDTHSRTDSSADFRAEVQASLGDRYVIERELGGGGMSRVFVAHEPGLGRKVVVKVVARDRVARMSPRRFEREIRLVATLQQANIVPLLAAGSADGFSYYTMPFVEGRSLHERLAREGPLPVAEAVNVLRDIARALAYAHERGIVHRDIKPGNVLLSGRTAVVTDFGIAKALGDARDQDEMRGPVSQAGTAIGTPAYIAPEQAAGDPATDHRADIYAFGCIAYAVFTGKPPFHGRTSRQIIAAHWHDAPASLLDARADVPPPIAALVARCLEKNPAARPQSTAELLQTLDAVATVNSTIAVHRRSPVAARGGMALAAIVVGAVTVFAVRRPPETLKPVAFGDVSNVGTRNSAALDRYRLGQELLKRRGSGIAQGIRAFEQAIQLDPNFARAWAALARALEFLPYFDGTSPASIRDRVIRAAGNALALDSTLADAHTALGSVYANDGQWDRAKGEFLHALALEPDNFEAHVTYARRLTQRGEVVAALAEFQRARKLQRISALVSAWTSYLLYANGQTDSALVESARAFELDSTQLATMNWGAWVNVATGHPDAARRLVALIPEAGPMSIAPYVYAKLGDTATAWRLVRAMNTRVPRPWFADAERAGVALAIGDTAAALTALEQSASVNGHVWAEFLVARDPMFDSVRRSPRFAALVRRAGLDVALMTSPHPGG